MPHALTLCPHNRGKATVFSMLMPYNEDINQPTPL